MPSATASRTSRLSPKLEGVLARLCQRLGPLYTTQAVKLPYLVDVVATHALGERITAGSTYQAWEHGVVAREVYRFVKHAQDPGIFTIEAHPYSEGGLKISLAAEPPEVLTEDEIAIVDFVAEQYGRLPVDELGLLTKRLNIELSLDQWGSNAAALVNEDAYLRLSSEWQDLCDELPRHDLEDRSKWSEPVESDPLGFLKRALNG